MNDLNPTERSSELKLEIKSNCHSVPPDAATSNDWTWLDLVLPIPGSPRLGDAALCDLYRAMREKSNDYGERLNQRMFGLVYDRMPSNMQTTVGQVFSDSELSAMRSDVAWSSNRAPR
ncbi:MAG: hypothetical protein JNK19_03050 [Tabrizicola sp.]|nr:hypothetical protein [Tabrizicola sp.]